MSMLRHSKTGTDSLPPTDGDGRGKDRPATPHVTPQDNPRRPAQARPRAAGFSPPRPEAIQFCPPPRGAATVDLHGQARLDRHATTAPVTTDPHRVPPTEHQ